MSVENKSTDGLTLGGTLLILAVATLFVRLFAFHSVPWEYAFFPALVWAVSIVMRAFRLTCD